MASHSVNKWPVFPVKTCRNNESGTDFISLLYCQTHFAYTGAKIMNKEDWTIRCPFILQEV